MGETLVRRSALRDVYKAGIEGAEQADPGIVIEQRHNLNIWQVAAYADTTDKIIGIIDELAGIRPSLENRRAVVNESSEALWIGPNRWWLVAPEGQGDLSDALKQALGDDAALTDQSHGRVVLRVSGANVRELLSKGSMVDFHPSQFGAGWCRPTQIGHFACLIHCLDDAATVDIYVLRSFAVSFWEWLLDAAGEYGYKVK